MVNILDYIWSRIQEFRKSPPQKGAEYSMKKYRDTYKLLEEYDQKAEPDPKALADPGRLEEFIRDLQKGNGRRRTHPRV